MSQTSRQFPWLHILLGCSLLSAPASTQLQAENLRSPGFLEKARVGFDQIFDLDYDDAFATFERLAAEY